jgi:hypothetical protein
MILLTYHSIVWSFDHQHTLLGNVLTQFVHKIENSQSTAVDYQGLKKSPQDLLSYLKQLEGLNKAEYQKFTKDQKLAFWINAYNAYTLKLIIDHYPIISIKDIKPKGFLGSFSTPWKIEFIQLLGKKMTLDNIEHDVIRSKYNEARIHFAVNCASIGCPSLMKTPFVADKMDQQLDAAANNFLTNTEKNKIDPANKTIYLSKIFKWYGDDFKEKYKSDLNYIALIISSDPEIQKQMMNNKYKVKYLDYDWKLNQIKKN